MAYIEDPHLKIAILMDLDGDTLKNMAQTDKAALAILSQRDFWSQYFEKHGLLLLESGFQPSVEGYYREFKICQAVLRRVAEIVGKLKDTWVTANAGQIGNFKHQAAFNLTSNVLNTVPEFDAPEFHKFLHEIQYLVSQSRFTDVLVLPARTTIVWNSEDDSFVLTVRPPHSERLEKSYDQDSIRDILYRLVRLDGLVEVYVP